MWGRESGTGLASKHKGQATTWLSFPPRHLLPEQEEGSTSQKTSRPGCEALHQDQHATPSQANGDSGRAAAQGTGGLLCDLGTTVHLRHPFPPLVL